MSEVGLRRALLDAVGADGLPDTSEALAAHVAGAAPRSAHTQVRSDRGRRLAAARALPLGPAVAGGG